MRSPVSCSESSEQNDKALGNNVTFRIGNSSAPRWYDLSLLKLARYVDSLVEWGATSTELVLHHGEADEAIRRVHILEHDWHTVFEVYRQQGLVCHIHAPLHPRFKLDRWLTEQDALQSEFVPILRAAETFAERQGETCVIVLHCASGVDAREATAGFADWALQQTQPAGSVLLSLELRSAVPGADPGFDRARSSLSDFVQWFGDRRLGICWDVAHDWESRLVHQDWSTIPYGRFLSVVNHVHLHDAGIDENLVHFPLQANRVPWRAMLAPLIAGNYQGAVTMEIRYRCALAMGDPWSVLQGSYAIFESFLSDARQRAPTQSDAAAAPN
jgi:sugar phosphate isomerase/epimerase